MSACIYGKKKGFSTTIYESTNIAGGRCRSFYDNQIGIEIDNGNHLVLSANTNFYELCKNVKSTKSLKKIAPNFFFYSYQNKKYWNLNLNDNSFPIWVFDKNKRIPETKIREYFSFFNFFFVNRNLKVKDLIPKSRIYKSFWEPFTLGIMNTSPDDASAKVLSNVLKKTIFRGKNKCYVYQPINNWHGSLINPALNFLSDHNIKINYSMLLKKMVIQNNKIIKLVFNKKEIQIKENEIVISALPINGFNKFFPKISLPKKFNTILNIHFKLSNKILGLFKKDLIGMVDSVSQWIFVKKKHISVTVSNANEYNNISSEEIAKIVWDEICSYLKKKIKIPKYRVIKEKNATYHQSPENNKLIKNINNLPKNLLVVGDWTQYDLPCTIEGSILSGKKAIESLKFSD